MRPVFYLQAKRGMSGEVTCREHFRLSRPNGVVVYDSVVSEQDPKEYGRAYSRLAAAIEAAGGLDQVKATLASKCNQVGDSAIFEAAEPVQESPASTEPAGDESESQPSDEGNNVEN